MERESIWVSVGGKPFLVNRLIGEGQCSCHGCEAKRGWNRHWTSFCYEWNGNVYCKECLGEELAKHV